MWNRVSSLDELKFERAVALWLSPEGWELLLLTDQATVYWSLEEGKQLWSIREKAGGEGLAPTGLIYRDLSSGLFYPVMGLHGGEQLRATSSGDQITIDQEAGQVVISGPDGATQSIEYGAVAGDWLVASFSQSGEYLVVAEPTSLAVYQRE